MCFTCVPAWFHTLRYMVPQAGIAPVLHTGAPGSILIILWSPENPQGPLVSPEPSSS